MELVTLSLILVLHNSLVGLPVWHFDWPHCNSTKFLVFFKSLWQILRKWLPLLKTIGWLTQHERTCIHPVVQGDCKIMTLVIWPMAQEQKIHTYYIHVFYSKINLFCYVFQNLFQVTQHVLTVSHLQGFFTCPNSGQSRMTLHK